MIHMNFRLNELWLYNLRNVTTERPLYIDLRNQMLTILDGPNGYGKTTFFDAVELLITGKLDHFIDGLYSKGKESLSSVAKNSKEATIIKANAYVKELGNVTLKRTFNWESNEDFYPLEIITSDETITLLNGQQEIFEFFGISSSIYNIGMYISQNDSLKFLKLPYNKRKDQFSAITGTEIDENKLKYLNAIRSGLNDKKKALELQQNKRLVEMQVSIDELSKKVKDENDAPLTVNYQRLFYSQEYEFDQVNIDVSKLSIFLSTLDYIKAFLKNRDTYLRTLENQKINQILTTDNNYYAAIYYKHQIEELVEKEKNILQMIEFEKIKNELESKNKISSNILNSLFKEVFGEQLAEINRITTNIEGYVQQLDGINKQKSILQSARDNLNRVHKEHHLLKDDQCPYCGSDVVNLEVVFSEFSNYIGVNKSEITQKIRLENDRLVSFIKDEFLSEITKYLSENQEIIMQYQSLQPYLLINPDNLIRNLNSFNLIDDFMSNETLEKAVESVKDKVRKNILSVTKTLTEKEISRFSRIDKTIFNNEEPVITAQDVENKKIYISETVNRQALIDLVMKKEELKVFEEKKATLDKELESKIALFSKFGQIYNGSINKYRDDFLRDIKVPLYVISGRIMQTSPIGLGIEAKISDRRVEFTAGEVEHDVINMLSAGQLNGLIISLMLSVQKIYLSNKGIKLLMIDDPLQSIDDLSSHSFVDLLTQEFSENQILLSTHELEKTAMFYYKYRQAGIPLQRINLQQRYLKE